MHSHDAARLVPGDPPAVRQVVAVLAAQLWGDRSRTLLDEAGERIDAIASTAEDDDVDVWITWWFSARPGGTWVEAQVDELDTGAEPPDVAWLLDAVAGRLATSPRAAWPLD